MTHDDLVPLLRLNKVGLIPGPGETLEAFTKRADYCLHLKNYLSEELKTVLNDGNADGSAVLEPALATCSPLYDIAPRWIPVFFSNHKLPAWQGGCAWIFQVDDTTPTAALVQLRRSFKTSQKYLGIYSRDELLTHELVHAGRMEFHEPRFEELLAYRTSPSRFRRWFGPLVQSSIESGLFMLALFMLLLFDAFLISTGRMDALAISLWLKLIPAILILWALARLWKRHKTFEACLANLKATCSDKNALAVAYRLTDREIALFATLEPEAIRGYAAQHAAEEPRWQVIHNAYFS